MSEWQMTDEQRQRIDRALYQQIQGQHDPNFLYGMAFMNLHVDSVAAEFPHVPREFLEQCYRDWLRSKA